MKHLRKNRLNIGLIVGVFVLGLMELGPGKAMADDLPHPTEAETKAISLKMAAMGNTIKDYGALPKSETREFLVVTATAYTSDPAETDATPWITASGTTCRHGVVAANFLPIGTKIKIPKLYGDQLFTVEDRMNTRFPDRLDIWMDSKSEAKQFGIRTIQMEIEK